jgi:ribonuclease D
VNEQIYLLDGAALDLTPFWNKLFLAQQNIFMLVVKILI